MTVAVQTLAGRVWHLAADRKHPQTFCGLMFSDGLDDVQELNGEQTICQYCQKVRLRRRRRGVAT